jgi:hypothetical protein
MKSDSPPPPPPEDDDVYNLDLPLDDAADESEREQALREVLDLASGRKPATKPSAPAAAQPPVKPATKAPVKSTARFAAPDPDLALDVVPATPEQERLKAAAIREVVEAAERTTRAVQMAKPMESYRARPIVLAALAIPALLLCLYTYLARPEWVFGPGPAAALTPRGEGHLRFATFLVAQRVFAFRDSTGGLPRTLAEVREQWPEIQYRLIDDSRFELRAQVPGGRPIVFRSDEDPVNLMRNGQASLRIQQP